MNNFNKIKQSCNTIFFNLRHIEKTMVDFERCFFVAKTNEEAQFYLDLLYDLGKRCQQANNETSLIMLVIDSKIEKEQGNVYFNEF
jgi:hypothetical protein